MHMTTHPAVAIRFIINRVLILPIYMKTPPKTDPITKARIPEAVIQVVFVVVSSLELYRKLNRIIIKSD